MREQATLKIKESKKKQLNMKLLFLVALGLFLFSPFTGISSMYGMVGDTAIQIKTGMDGISSGHLMLDEIYSWHPGLTWTAHEEGWYFLLGGMYKWFGLAGVIAVGTIFNYGTVILVVNRIKDKVNPLIAAAVMVILPVLNGFPDYNVRPSVTSAFFITLLILTMTGESSTIKKTIVFVASAYALAWLHGGILPVFFAVYAVFMVIELLYRKWKNALIGVGVIAGTFAITLLNPIGIRLYTFGLKQMGATDIWQHVNEWQPSHFSVLQSVIVLLPLIGFMLDDRVKLFEKKVITKLAMYCMFFVMTCMYTRFVLYFSIVYMLYAPELIQNVLVWVNKNLFKLKTDKIELSGAFYGLIAFICIGILGGTAFIYSGEYLKTNSMTDIEVMAAYDVGAVDFIKEQGYQKVFNTFNTGSWLAFYDVPVHIDNRIDPFMQEYSGVDHIRGKMGIDSLSDLDAFRNEYDNDAFLLDIGTGYSPLLYEIAKYAPDRYKVVYDNTKVSNLSESIAVRWVVIECI